jgi:exosortase
MAVERHCLDVLIHIQKHRRKLETFLMSPKPLSHWRCQDWPSRAVVSGVLLGLLAFVFRDLLTDCVTRWTSEPQYSHGFIIPLMAVGLAWYRRDKILPGDARSHVNGLLLVGIGMLCHLLAGYFYVDAIDAAGFLFSLTGLVLLIWGQRFFRGVWPAVLFMGFMLPLPFQVERMLSDPLQVLGASESAWFIQAFGIPAIAQGNTILMGDTQLGVAEACSGLRMLMVFFAISAAAVIISRRTRWEKLLILFSAIPIALISNIVRIVATAVAYQYASRKTADLIFHDLSGWLMMPFAMLLLYLELRLIDCLLVEVTDAHPAISYHRMPGGCTVNKGQ